MSDELEPQLLRKGKELLVEDHSDKARVEKLWHPYRGRWKVTDGVMRANSIVEEESIANARIVMRGQDKIFQFRFRFVEEGKLFHFGFDPDTKELDKSGSLFSLIISEKETTLTKHRDRRPEKNDPEEVLETKLLRIRTDKWYVVMLERGKEEVVAQFQEERGGEITTLKAEHKTFKVDSPMIVFRCIGDGVEIDDIHVREGR